MKYKLISENNVNLTAIQTILMNRGVPKEQAFEYLNTTDAHINDFNLLGAQVLHAAYYVIEQAITKEENCLVIVDSDCDGYTASAVLINYLHDLYPEWVENHLQYFMHEGKQHGLQGVVVPEGISLVIVPDAGSNDYLEHMELSLRGIEVLVLDHHEAERVSEYAIIVNNQLSNYPNKNLSGVGVVWQLCRYIDEKTGNSYAEDYYDLVSLGLNADMMSLLDLETKHLINKGLEKNHVKNPFFFFMADKNSFSLKGKLTPIGVAFYIAPFVNAMTRSGTQAEKDTLFKSMLKHEAFKKVPSTKRGHKPGDEERIVDQAIRIATNVKNRQTKGQITGMDALNSMIADRNLLDNKVLLFLCSPGAVPRNIAGLVANKFMAKYQRNVAVLFPSENENGEKIWQGSARGTQKSAAAGFKDLCEETGVVEYAQGHLGAFGLGILDKNIQKFIEITNEMLKHDDGEAIYSVDYIYDGKNVREDDILTIAGLDNLWGKDMPEAYIAIEGLKVTKEMLTLMSPDKRPTLKIALSNGVSIIKFGSSQEEYEKFYSDNGYIEINLVGTCAENEWNGNISAQIMMKDFDIVGTSKYAF